MTEEAEGPGAALRAAREGLGVSPREVAEALNLPVHVIEAMESNDYERLPQAVFARGYLRSYARLLELDPDAIVARLPIGEDETITSEVAATDPTVGGLQRNPARVLWIGAAAGIVLLVLLVWWLSGREPDAGQAPVEQDTPAAAATGTEPATDNSAVGPDGMLEPDVGTIAEPGSAVQAARTAAQPAQQTADDAQSHAPDAGLSQPEASTISTPDLAERRAEQGEADSAAAPVTTQAAEAAAAPPTQVVAPAATSTAGEIRRITEFGDDRLTFTFSDDCWVEVKSASGTNLYSDLSRAGATLKLLGQGPFRILLGYAPGVSLEFNDERVALAPHTRNNVATLVLGQ